MGDNVIPKIKNEGEFKVHLSDTIKERTKNCYDLANINRELASRFFEQDQQLQRGVVGSAFFASSMLTVAWGLNKIGNKVHPLMITGFAFFSTITAVAEFYTHSNFGPAGLTSTHKNASQEYYRLAMEYERLAIDLEHNRQDLSSVLLDYNKLQNSGSTIAKKITLDKDSL